MHKYGISSDLCVRALLYSEDGSICVMRHSLTHWPPTPHSLTQLSLPHPISQSVRQSVGRSLLWLLSAVSSLNPSTAGRSVGRSGRSVGHTYFIHALCLFVCVCTVHVKSAVVGVCSHLFRVVLSCCGVVESLCRCVSCGVVESLCVSCGVVVVELLLWSCCCC